MRVDGRSRLPDEEGCAKGYIRVSPFMKEAKYERTHFIERCSPDVCHLFH